MSEPPCGPARDSDPMLVTRDTYDRSAEEYLRAAEDYERFPGLRDDVAAFADMTRDDLPLLDLGSGGGRDSRFLAGLGRRVVAVDYSLPMLACMSAQSNHMADRITYTCCDMLALPFADGRFGGVWASGSVLHLPSPDIPAALREIFRTLAPGGIAELSMRAGETEGWRTGGSLSGRRWFTLVEPGEFTSLMRQVGFRPVESRFSGRQDWYVARGRK
jgi:SAM-dependent methyltransferase